MFTAILEFFALGTLGFWILCSLISVIFIVSIENENHWFPTCVIVAFAAAYWKSFIALAIGWQAIAIAALVYVVAGVVWSLFRWTRFVKESARKYREQYGDSLSESDKRSLKSEISPVHNKSRITGWIAYWPWSLVWNITGDFFKMIYEGLQSVYKNIAERELSKFTEVKDVRR